MDRERRRDDPSGGYTIVPTMASTGRKARVVLVDDHPSVLVSLGGMLRTCCDLVASVSSGYAAIEAVDRLRPDVLVADLMMPDMDGLEVCRRVKQLAPDTAVVIITASDDTAVRAVAIRDGAAAFVPKHLAAETLPRAIEEVFADAVKRGLGAI